MATANRSDLTLQGGPNQHGTYLPRRTIWVNHSPPRLELQDRPTIIWSAEPYERPPKVKHASPILRGHSTTLRGGKESCTFEVRQYSAYRFWVPPTPGMWLVQYQTRSAGPDNGRSLTDTDGAKQFPSGLKFHFLSFLNAVAHSLKYKDILYLTSNRRLLDFYRVLFSMAVLSTYTY